MAGLMYYQVGWTIEDCETGLSEALAEKRDLPTALFAESDYLAVGALKGLQAVSYTHLDVYKRQDYG